MESFKCIHKNLSKGLVSFRFCLDVGIKSDVEILIKRGFSDVS
jgi:hypothetical protein